MKISDIKPNPQNPRTIKDENFTKLVQSIQTFPEMLEARPLILNKDKIILGGNMRFKAAKEAGLKEIPVKIVDWSEEKQKEFIIKDNVSGGDWDWDTLANEWDAEELDAWGLELPEAWKEEAEIEEDEAPEASDEPPVSELGKIYQLGRHRVMCGSATELDSVVSLADGNKADLILTDPPYNMAYTGSATARREAIINDKIDNFGEFVNDFMASMVAVAKTSAPYYVFTSEPEVQTIKSGFVINGLKPHQTLIWKKHRFGFGGADYQHQSCYGMELDPRYVDVIRKRYAKFTNNNELPDNWEELTAEV